MDAQALVAFLAAAVTAGTPILYAALGEIVAERAGVLNLGVEGMMLVGAALGFVVSIGTGNSWLGLIAALLVGGVMGLIHAIISVVLKGNQVVSGLALTIFGTGLSAFLGKTLTGSPVPAPFRAVDVPVLSKISGIGTIFFQHDILVYASYVLVAAIWFILFRTRLGLHIRAVGENPAAADVAGIEVNRVRVRCTVFGGMMAGVAGAYLSLAYSPTWIENMTAGRGWIAVALVIFAMWNPAWAILGSYLFGGVSALGYRLQTMGVIVSPFFLDMLPYLLTILVMCLVIIKLRDQSGAPSALSVPYFREER